MSYLITVICARVQTSDTAHHRTGAKCDIIFDFAGSCNKNCMGTSEVERPALRIASLGMKCQASAFFVPSRLPLMLYEVGTTFYTMQVLHVELTPP